MKYISSIFVLVIISFSWQISYAADETLTIKQQLERVIEEVKDLNKAVRALHKEFKLEK